MDLKALYLLNDDNNITYLLKLLWKLSEMVNVKQLAKCWTHRRHSISNIELYLGHHQATILSGPQGLALRPPPQGMGHFQLWNSEAPLNMSQSLETKPREMQEFSLPCLTPTAQPRVYYLKWSRPVFFGEHQAQSQHLQGLEPEYKLEAHTTYIYVYNLQSKLNCLIFCRQSNLAPTISGTCGYATLHDKGILLMGLK